jgi:hypothetical protein
MSTKSDLKKIIVEMLEESNKSMIKKIDRLLDWGVVDVESWGELEYGKMILPKCIIMALLINESDQYSAKGTSFEKESKKQVKNLIRYL